MSYEKNKTSEHPFLKWVWDDGAPEWLVCESFSAPSQDQTYGLYMHYIAS